MRERLSHVRIPDRARREALLIRIERLTELPLLIMAFAMIPLLVGPLLWTLTPEEEATFIALDSFIWAAFAADLGFKIIVAPDRLGYIRSHWLEVLVVVIPFARPLRLIRLFVFGSRAFVGARRLTNIDFLLVYGIGVVLIGATVVTSLEAGHNSAIDSFPDALWWSVVTVTTVGYGDMVPVTAGGRAIALILMIGGIGLFGGLTANLASFLVRTESSQDSVEARLLQEIRSLREELARVNQGGGAS